MGMTSDSGVVYISIMVAGRSSARLDRVAGSWRTIHLGLHYAVNSAEEWFPMAVK
jgi:hypothetical protein